MLLITVTQAKCFSSLTWLPLPKPPQMTCLPSSLPFTSSIITVPRLEQAMQRYWYLSEHLVLLALADDDIELELKSKILDKLLDLYKIGKPDLPVVLMSTELYDPVVPQS
jgi:hypothetical protein